MFFITLASTDNEDERDFYHSHPPMTRMKEVFITRTSTDDENERDENEALNVALPTLQVCL